VDISIQNGSDKPIQGCPVDVFKLELPHVPANTPLGAQRELDVRLCKHEKGFVALRGFDLYPHGKGMTVRLPGPYPARKAFHPVVADHWFSKPGDVIEPGETETYRASLVCGARDSQARDFFPALYASARQDRSMTLDWAERRPIATIFLCNPATGSKINPRGWFQANREVDITTKEGIEDFGQRLLEYADRCVVRMKEMNAQGVIVWDIEGQEMPHMISYIGDPRAVPELAPEMDRYADAFMKKFSDAGFKTGVTIRPTQISRPDPKRRCWTHREVADPVALMSDKIRYARRRWGSTIFYMDSNVFGKDHIQGMEPARGVDWVMPGAMVRALHQQHPECLIIPEWSQREYFAYSAPYSSANLRQGGTSDSIRQVWPKAFRVVSVNPGLLAARWSDYVHSVQGGDILLFPPWYAARENSLVSGVYREAEYLRALGSHKGNLRELAAADAPAARYAAAHRLGEEQKADALLTLLDDEDVVVRRRALQSLAAGPPITNAVLLERLAALFEGNRNDRESAILRKDAGKALARAGARAIPHLLPLLDDRRMQLQAVAALGETGVTDGNVVAHLREMICDESLRADAREQAVKTVGKLRAESAVPELLEVLKIEERNLEYLRGAAVVALGQIGDSRAVGPLVEHLDARYSTVVVYWIERALDDALRSLTGVKGVVGRQEWRAWAEQQDVR
jgi:hypothetical protein